MAVTIDGGAGDDKITFTGSSLVHGGDGNDTLDGSAAGIGITLNGDAGNDSLVGSSSADTINGGAGDDTITGGQGRDVLSGGGGNDEFVFNHGDSSTTGGLWDQITDWSSTNKLHFTSAAAIANGNYTETTAADAATAFSTASTDIGSGAHDVVVVQVGTDTLVFVDDLQNNTVGNAVVLIGKTLADIDFSNFI